MLPIRQILCETSISNLNTYLKKEPGYKTGLIQSEFLSQLIEFIKR